jgi:hypothetical protein
LIAGKNVLLSADRDDAREATLGIANQPERLKNVVNPRAVRGG